MLQAIQSKPATMFHSVGHALAVAFLIMSTEARQDSTTRAALLAMMETADKLSADQVDWYDELRGSASGTLDFSGLSSIEIRAQCALIVSAVRSKLTGPEMWAVQARHAVTEFEMENGQRRFAFSLERTMAVQGLADWLRPSFPALPSASLDCLVAKCYANHGKTKISYRDLERSFGAGKSTFERAAKEVKRHLHTLELNAVRRLEPYFVEHGLVPYGTS